MPVLRIYLFTTLLLGVSRIFAQTVIYNEPFNSSLNTCTATNNSNGGWGWTNACLYSGLGGHTASGSALFTGSGCLFGNGGATVSGNLITPTIALGSTGAILNFNYLRVGETVGYWDVLSAQVSTNNGLSYTTVLHSNIGGGLIGYSAFTPTANNIWQQACCNLSAYANQTVIVRFNFNSLDGIANNYDGIYVDDVTLITPGPLTVSQSTNNVCPGTAVTLSTNAVSGFSWSTGSTSQVIVVTPTVTTTYFVNSCSGSAGGSGTLVVNVAPQLSLTVSTSQPGTVFCTSTPVSLIATASGGVPGYSYLWQGSSTGGTYPANQQTPGTYVYTVTATDAHPCIQTRTASLLFIQSPTLNAIPAQTICSGNTVTFTATGAHTYTWLPSGTPGSTIAVTPNVPTTYSVTGSNTVTGCTNTGTAAVYFKPRPTLGVVQASITCASLGFGTVTATGGVGPFSYLWSPTNQTTAIASNLNTSTYTISVNDAGTGCITTTTTQFTPLTPLVGQLVNDTILLCHNIANASAHFTNLANGSGTELYTWTNGLTTFTVSNPSALDIGTWSVTVSDALTGCSIFSVFTITEPPLLVLNLSASSPSICMGGQVVVTSTTSGGTPGYSYQWAGGPNTSTRTILENTPGTYSYALTATDLNACVATSTLSLDFVPNPVLSVSDVTICPLAIGTLTVSGATSYTWNGTVTGSTYTNSPAADTEYTVTGSALGCTSVATASIILFPSPVPILTMTSQICESFSVQLNASGGSLFQWQGPSGFNSGISNPVINVATLNHTGVYNLTVTSVNGCTASTSSSLTVNPTPSLSATGATVCTSQTLQLLASSVPGVSFAWTGPLAFNSNVQNPAIPKPSVSRSGFYYVVATTPPGCKNTMSVTALVVPPPPLTGYLSSSSLCSQAFNGSPNSITLTASGANTYSIITVPDMSIGNPGGPVTNLTAIPPNTGAASATLSGSNGICTVTMALTFSIIPNPSITVASTPVICAGQSYTYTNQGATSYTWSNTTPGLTTYNNGGIAVANPSINSVFSVYGGSLGCHSPSKTSTITVNPLPVVKIAPLQPTLCLYETATLTVIGTATAFVWQHAPGFISSSGATASVSPLYQQVYSVTGELDNCFASASTTVEVNPLPEPVILTSKNTFCENETITLSGEGGIIYEWFGPGNLYYQKQAINIKAMNGGTYSLTVTDKYGCRNTTKKLLTVHQSPQGSLLGFKESGCLPLCNAYEFKANGSNASSTWQIGNQTFGNSFSYCFPEAGTHTLSGLVHDNNTGCENKIELIINVFPKPVADFYYQPLHPVENLDEVKFVNSSTGKDQVTWNWFFENNNGFQSGEENLSYLFSEPGEYPVAFVVTDKNFCQDTVIKVVKVEPDFTIYIPDAFTPNGDQVNDVFLPVVRSSRLYTLSVFDRWGKRIFYSTSPQTGWDGTFMGSECKMDVYTYQVALTTVSGEKKDYTGHVSLVR